MSNTPDLRNSLVVTRGQKEDLHLAVWDAVGVCTGNEDSDEDRCPLHLDCPYLVVTNPNLLRLSTGGSTDPDKCVLQAKYLDYIYKSLVLDNRKHLDQHQVDSIGLHLLPLYGHLIKFKMIEFAVNNNVIVSSMKGLKAVHPIYKEIRETIKTIAAMWRDIGLREAKVTQPGNPDLEALMLNGDPSYYEGLCEQTEREPEVVEKVKTPAQQKYEHSDKWLGKKLRTKSSAQLLRHREEDKIENTRRTRREYARKQRAEEKAERPMTVEEEMEAFDREMEERTRVKPARDEDPTLTKVLKSATEERVKEPNRMIRKTENDVRSARLRRPIPTN